LHGALQERLFAETIIHTVAGQSGKDYSELARKQTFS